MITTYIYNIDSVTQKFAWNGAIYQISSFAFVIVIGFFKMSVAHYRKFRKWRIFQRNDFQPFFQKMLIISGKTERLTIDYKYQPTKKIMGKYLLVKRYAAVRTPSSFATLNTTISHHTITKLQHMNTCFWVVQCSSNPNNACALCTAH